MALFMLLGAGCATQSDFHLYEGPVRPETETGKIEVPWGLDILSVNDKKFTRRFLDAENFTLTLLPDTYTIELRYKDVWDSFSGDDEVVVSKPTIISIRVKAKHNYALHHRPLLDLADAKTFAANPKISVIDTQTGRQLEAPVTITGSNMNNISPKVVGTATANTLTTALEKPQDNIDDKATAEPSAFHQLQHWWKQAGPQERAQFKSWLEGVKLQ